MVQSAYHQKARQMKQALADWIIIDDLMISVTTAGVMPQDAWDRLIQQLKTQPIKKLLATSVGSTDVDSIKRKTGTDVVKTKNIQVATVTDDKIVRGLVTAASWLGANIKAFSWLDLRAAIKHLRVPADQEDDIYSSAMELRARVEKASR
jgi:hypothetical protein